MEQVKTIVSVSNEIYNNIEYKERTNGEKYCCLKDHNIQWQSDIIREAHLDRLPDDDIYDRINTILDVISSLDEDSTEDNIREAIQEIEADIYTYNLTGWLHDHNENVYYLEEAIKDGIQDGFKALMYAQYLYIQEIGDNLLNAIQKYIENDV